MSAQLNDKLYAERQGIGGTITVGDIVALSSGGAPKWFDYIIGADSNSLNTQIATGYVINYVYGTVTRFRLKPTGTEPDAFYTTFTSGVLSGLLAKKPQQL